MGTIKKVNQDIPMAIKLLKSGQEIYNCKAIINPRICEQIRGNHDL